MTDDYLLFPDPADDGPAIDPDVALIAAYLARELSRVQVLAVERRLVSDPEFRGAVQPILDSWDVPIDQLPDAPPATAKPLLSPDEVEEGWRRYVATVRPRQQGNSTRRERRSMARAAGIAACIILPMTGLAQLVVLSPRFAEWPGVGAVRSLLGFNAPSRPIAELPLASPPSNGQHPVGDSMRSVATSGGIMVIARGGPSSVPALALEQPGSPPPIHPIGAVSAVVADSLSELLEIRSLSTGAVLVSDQRNRRLILLDSARRSTRVILDAKATDVAHRYADAVGSAQLPPASGMLARWAGDSTLFFDFPSRSYLVIGPDGALGRTKATPNFPPLLRSRQGSRNALQIDPLGRILDLGALRQAVQPATRARPSDTTILGRRGFGVDDSVARLKTPRYWGIGGPMANPIPTNDDWAILPDGGIAIIRMRDFHVDWIEPDGRRWSGPPMPFPWTRLTDADKQRVVDSLHEGFVNKPFEGNLSLGGAGSSRYYTNYIPDMIATDALPDYTPPFAGGTAMADEDGHVWIRVLRNGALPTTAFQGARPSVRPDTAPPLYYVFDRKGAVDRVELPRDAVLVGFAKGGVVYLRRPRQPVRWTINPPRDPFITYWELIRVHVR